MDHFPPCAGSQHLLPVGLLCSSQPWRAGGQGKEKSFAFHFGKNRKVGCSVVLSHYLEKLYTLLKTGKKRRKGLLEQGWA